MVDSALHRVAVSSGTARDQQCAHLQRLILDTLASRQLAGDSTNINQVGIVRINGQTLRFDVSDLLHFKSVLDLYGWNRGW